MLGIPENVRGQVNSVESSLTNLASLLVFVGSLVFSSPKQFFILVWSSAFFILSGAVVYAIWICRWEVHRDLHSHADEDANSHQYLHTAQHDMDLKGNEAHEHTHTYFRRRKNFVYAEEITHRKPVRV